MAGFVDQAYSSEGGTDDWITLASDRGVADRLASASSPFGNLSPVEFMRRLSTTEVGVL